MIQVSDISDICSPRLTRSIKPYFQKILYSYGAEDAHHEREPERFRPAPFPSGIVVRTDRLRINAYVTT